MVNRAILARTHLVPVLGRRRLVEFTVHDVDAWFADGPQCSAPTQSTGHTRSCGRCFAARRLMTR